MAPRPYEMRQRAESAAETRERIVRATMDVHFRRGISGATVREIAEVADVSPGTVLRHFPEMGDLVQACGRMTTDLYPFPDASVLDGVAEPDRLRTAVGAIFGYYDQQPLVVARMVEGERNHWPQVDAFAREDEDTRRALLDAAFPRGRGKRRERLLALALAITTWKSRESLRDEGLDLDAATDAVVGLLTAADAAR